MNVTSHGECTLDQIQAKELDRVFALFQLVTIMQTSDRQLLLPKVYFMKTGDCLQVVP
ncbi:MAG: hypothetical protein CLLPBCKN_006502 [Chroococcidiopsis cubana SAG 39.79]|nr:hypothetical protein [Chroococcidiopsis cubana SAG 39.79]